MGIDENQLELVAAIRELYAIVTRLEAAYPGRHFTPDGHLVGSLGEVYAAQRYGIHLFEASHETHDGYWPDSDDDARRRLVQIKVTQRNRVALSDCPDYLIVLLLSKEGAFREVYNGPGEPVWKMRGKPQKTSQFQISVRKLERVSQDVTDEDRIPPIG